MFSPALPVFWTLNVSVKSTGSFYLLNTLGITAFFISRLFPLDEARLCVLLLLSANRSSSSDDFFYLLIIEAASTASAIKEEGLFAKLFLLYGLKALCYYYSVSWNLIANTLFLVVLAYYPPMLYERELWNLRPALS